ncbi:MFS transporter [Leminorella grimontii]|uniref:MFS transporter n=1 Tax=Leminorella grimontii TaxID=82981 RepID=A0AAV5N4C9_9GAMM|nr:MFS transporter [Leminorella grimontii]KFC94678.1 nitrate/nitrite transporter [Leminorella grimontii ATCC 33999 = DSM 5078]GKX56420.1 MFS transporter [Leminorella grimontii]GKX59979.1 MFS transporter [Leminorella grimontii]VFS61269.1 Inner membrane transport protein RhmT [Leminorella grimontii]
MTMQYQGIGRRWLLFIPIASIMYMLAFLDRTNLSFILPYIGQDLHLTNSTKGMASGIFFLGYLLLQVPAALLAERWSAKKTIFLLMLLWGVAAIWTGMVQSTNELLLARFVLGVFEGGVQPATLVLLLKWFPQREKARANGFWLMCIPISAIIAAPITGFLLEHFSWRTVLIIEGFPPIIWAIVWYIMVADSPAKVWWMEPGERSYIVEAIAKDEAQKKSSAVISQDSARYRDVFRNGKVLTLIVAWFLYCAGFYGFTMWLPQVIANTSGSSPAMVGILTAIPYLVGLIGMIIIAVRTDKIGLRKSSAALPLTITAVALLCGQLFPSPVIQFVFLCIVASGLYIHGAFFALPPLILRSDILALSLGLIGGIGNLGGFVGPYVVGWLIDLTGTTMAGFGIMAAALFFCGVALASVTPKAGEKTAEQIGAEPEVESR